MSRRIERKIRNEWEQSEASFYEKIGYTLREKYEKNTTRCKRKREKIRKYNHLYHLRKNIPLYLTSKNKNIQVIEWGTKNEKMTVEELTVRQCEERKRKTKGVFFFLHTTFYIQTDQTPDG